jgi:hypothetical protein
MAKRRKVSPGDIPKVHPIKRSRMSRVDVTRGEYNRIIDILNERNAVLNAIRDAIQRLEQADAVQLHRTGQIQLELDEVKRAWARIKSQV